MNFSSINGKIIWIFLINQWLNLRTYKITSKIKIPPLKIIFFTKISKEKCASYHFLKVKNKKIQKQKMIKKKKNTPMYSKKSNK